MSTFLRPPEMLQRLGDFLGPDATPEQAEQLFDALVIRGLLRPWEQGFWELEGLDATFVQQIVQSLG